MAFPKNLSKSILKTGSKSKKAKRAKKLKEKTLLQGPMVSRGRATLGQRVRILVVEEEAVWKEGEIIRFAPRTNEYLVLFQDHKSCWFPHHSLIPLNSELNSMDTLSSPITQVSSSSTERDDSTFIEERDSTFINKEGMDSPCPEMSDQALRQILNPISHSYELQNNVKHSYR